MSRTGTTTRDRARRARRPAERRNGTPVTPLPSRRRPRPDPARRRPLRAAVAALVLATVAWVLWASPLLGVRTVQVDGAAMLSAAEVRTAAGVAPGTPLLRVDVEATRVRVARLPQVASVKVTRGWPSTVVITVVERRPVAVVGEPGQRQLIDAAGVLFDTVTGDPPKGVAPLDVAHPRPGDPATMAALAALGELPAGVRTQIRVAAAPSAEDITLTLTDGTVVQWGPADRSAAKAAALVGLLKQIKAGALDRAGTIDLSTPDAVVLR